MLVCGNAGHRRPRLALAAGAQGDDLMGLQVRELVLIEILEILRQVSRGNRNVDHAMHGPAGHHQLPSGAPRGIGHGAQARDIGREDGDGHAALGAA